MDDGSRACHTSQPMELPKRKRMKRQHRVGTGAAQQRGVKARAKKEIITESFDRNFRVPLFCTNFCSFASYRIMDSSTQAQISTHQPQ
eukprot:4803813-Amphidinium_carterae.1